MYDLLRLLPRSKISWPGGGNDACCESECGGWGTEVFVAGECACNAQVVAFVVFLGAEVEGNVMVMMMMMVTMMAAAAVVATLMMITAALLMRCYLLS